MSETGFVEFIQDQLCDLRGLACRRMFGGYGLYHGETFFGIIFRGRLFFKTDTSTAEHYRAHGMRPFRPSATQTLRSYYEVPLEVMEDAEELTAWARAAVACQASRSRARAPSARRKRGE